MEFDESRNVVQGASTCSAPNNGVANFLRHFSGHRNTKDESSQLKKSSRLLRNIGRSSNQNNRAKNNEDSIRPVSPFTTAFHRSKGKYFTHREEEAVITFDSDSTRLGIRPTCYDVPAGTQDCYDARTGSNHHIDEEVFFLSNNVAAVASVTPMSSTSVPNIFSSLPIWEETRQDDLYGSTHGGSTSYSPQKSVASCDSIKSDGNLPEDDCCNFIMPMSRSPLKERVNTNRNRSNSSCSVSSKVSATGNLIQKARSIVHRTRDKDNQSCDGSQISTSSSIISLSKASRKSRNGSNTSPHVDTVKIFLLLVEPKSKVFELIQLLYPRNKTKVIDLLKMIPQNATEQALATQSYVGITRPKRRADPITDLHFLASNSVFNIAGNPTASIESGEIIVAIPALTSTKEIVVLSKQILASAHIQKLISISKGLPSGGPTLPVDASGRNQVVKKRKSDVKRSSISKKSPSHLTGTSGLAYSNNAATFSPIQEPLSNESRSPKIVSFVDQNCSEELKRAIDNANLANEEAGCSPSITPTSFLSESIKANPSNEGKCVEFPRDMLDAYLSKDAVLKMCSTPENSCKIPNIECTSSSSMVDETEGTDVDVSSCDGSMTSSFHSWALSLESTSIPSMTRGNDGTLNVRTVASTSQLHGRKKKNLFTRKMKRVAMVLFFSSIARYHLDPNGIYLAQNLRCVKLFEPMGFVGFLYFALTLGALIKLQMYYTRYSGVVEPSPKTQCPVVRSISKLYKRFQRATNVFDSATKREDQQRHENH